MSAIRSFAKSCLILVLGRECRPRRIVRGLASGYRICVSPAGNLAYLLGMAEPHLQRAIRQYVAPGDTVYDVGANLGYVSLALAKRVGPEGRVFAFEPVPQSVDLLRRNVAVNQLKNIQVFDCAVSDQSGAAVIRVAQNLATASMVWHRNDSSVKEFVVRTVAIDDLVAAGELGSPKFVKIDVEGAEGQVLQGMRRTITSAKPVLFVECSEAGRDIAWDLLRELGYRCQSPITRRWVTAFEDYRHSDFLWLPSDGAA